MAQREPLSTHKFYMLKDLFNALDMAQVSVKAQPYTERGPWPTVEIAIEDERGKQLSRAEVIKETLSDGSVVYSIVLS